MSEGQLLGGLRRPGPGLKLVLIVLALTSLVTAVVGNWHVGGEAGAYALSLLPMMPSAVGSFQLWRLATSGLLTSGLGHIFFSLLGLYFLSPDLEKAMGKWRFVRFLLIAVMLGNLLAVVVDLAAPETLGIFHPGVMYGPGAAITATAVAWARANANAQVRLFFFLPVSGKQLYYATIGLCFLAIVYHEGVPEGVIAPFGGILTGVLFAGQPSPARAAYLRAKLLFLRRQKGHVSVESLLKDPAGAAKARRKAGGPELRVVLGGLEDKLKDGPPKDKRFLN